MGSVQFRDWSKKTKPLSAKQLKELQYLAERSSNVHDFVFSYFDGGCGMMEGEENVTKKIRSNQYVIDSNVSYNYSVLR